MRRMLICLTAAGVLLVAGCSDADGGGTATGGSTADFCKGFKAVQADATNIQATDDKAIDAAYDKLSKLDPPAEIATEYRKVIDTAKEFRAEEKKIDQSNTAELTKLQQRFADRQQELQAASDKLSQFLTDKCGIDPNSLGSEDGSGSGSGTGSGSGGN